ncbi:uncharacterized protein LOC111266085 [Varroa jacobsoni]|uniref:uncharacterized protein LOC111266085 n=1 Tax=Varroa jacobsoni TaxID=62625 RepID=UPI000BFA12F6|nr:uncharacterized protein LOC111266085 [Varroa jacobsoni]
MCESPSKPLKAATAPAVSGVQAPTEPPSTPTTDVSSRRISNGRVGLVNSAPPSKSDDVAHLTAAPPDGGWGWVVVFCSFMVHVLADGVTYSFGIFHLEFLEHFKESNGRTAWVASILVSTTFLCGPLASALTNLYGCRAVTITGAVLAAVGLFVSAWAPNVTCLYFSIGVVTGLGLGFMYLPAIVSVAMYFERRRAFATGIAVCGSGCGTFVLAPVIEFLVNYYGWRGALIITAGMLLQCAVFGALMRPPSYDQQLMVGGKSIAERATDPMLGDVDNNTALYPNENFTSSQHQIPCKDVKEPVPDIREILELEASDRLLKPDDAFGTLQLLDSKDKLHHKSVCHLSVNSEQELVLIRTPSVDRQLYLERENISCMQANNYASLKKRLSHTSQPSLSVHSVQTRNQRSPHKQFASFIKTIADSIDLALLLRSPVFILFALSNFFTSIGFNVPYVYIKDVARRKLAVEDSKAPLLLSMIGLSNTASRILLGLVFIDKTI